MSFAELGLNEALLRATQRMGFEHPTPIQRMAIPPLMQDRDVLATAMTGSGKTAAFLLPILHNLMGKRRGTTRALVVAPTRELAAQIAEHLRELAGQTGLTGAAVYGGVAMGPQEQAFRKGVDVLIATPGRLLDHLQYPYARLDGVEYLVLDEADRMLDMGFLPDVRRILQRLPKERRTLLFSATLPAPIVELANDMLANPVALNIERKSAPAVGVTHTIYPVSHDLKSHLLLELLRQGSPKSVLAFTRTKHRANRLADFLERRGVSCARIHGNRSQAQRTEALAGFKRGHFRVLVATDIAARGIDVEALGLVVNFDVPHLPEDYIHRVGRTARVEATGDAYTFVSPDEEGELRAIERHIGKRLPRQQVRLHQATRGATGSSPGRAHHGHPRAEKGGAGPSEGKRRSALGKRCPTTALQRRKAAARGVRSPAGAFGGSETRRRESRLVAGERWTAGAWSRGGRSPTRRGGQHIVQ
ncbi:MAG: putative ATP-dependent helicase with P-loop hydrolase domain (rhlE) [candidate division NC10 bacterium]|nr:putative ATP-dependent helicase with P-loop hydrolase domain (rhlE) [candidate division NC10 bacterium]